jgi:hypothetical protein
VEARIEPGSLLEALADLPGTSLAFTACPPGGVPTALSPGGPGVLEAALGPGALTLTTFVNGRAVAQGRARQVEESVVRVEEGQLANM